MSHTLVNCLRPVVTVQRCRHLLQPVVCTSLQHRSILYRRKYEWKEDYVFLLYKKYDFTVDGLKDMISRTVKNRMFTLQMFDEDLVKQQGLDQAAARKILELGGRVKFAHDPRWITVKRGDKMPVPSVYRKGFYLEGIDASESDLMAPGLSYLEGLEHLVYMNLSNSKYASDWFVEILSTVCPSLEYLDVSGCKNITSATLEVVHSMKNLKVLNITGCKNIKEADVVCDLLMDFVPELTVIGLDGLEKVGNRLQEHEHSTSRYLTWGTPVPEDYTKPSLSCADSSVEKLGPRDLGHTGSETAGNQEDRDIVDSEGTQEGNSDSSDDRKTRMVNR